MKRVFLDTNFLMDLLGRDPDHASGSNRLEETAIEVINQGDLKGIRFCASFLSVANFADIMSKEDKEQLYLQLKTICELFSGY